MLICSSMRLRSSARLEAVVGSWVNAELSVGGGEGEVELGGTLAEEAGGVDVDSGVFA